MCGWIGKGSRASSPARAVQEAGLQIDLVPEQGEELAELAAQRRSGEPQDSSNTARRLLMGM